MNIKRIRAIKYYCYKFGIHKVLPSSKLNFLAHLSAASKWISSHRDIPFTDFPSKDFDYGNRTKLFQFLIDKEIRGEAINYLEFGVSKGVSFRWWVDHLKNPETRFYGFDTFTGLPEPWGHFEKGAMSNGNKPPEIEGNRHKFYQGLFQQTLNNFLSDFKDDKRKVIHLDADIYSATLYVLTTLAPFINKGDILLFDEFNVPMHEFKAFSEWSKSFYIEYEVLGQVNNYYQVAMKII